MEEKERQFINELNREIIITHTVTAARLLKKKKIGVDAFTLYNFYCYCASWQITNKVYATDKFCIQGLHWGRTRFRRAKNLLIKEEIIETEARRNKKGKIIRHYVHIHYLNGFARSTKNHPVDETTSGSGTPNAYNKKGNALDKNKIVATQSVAGSELNDLIDLFKEVNPSYERLFGNKTQRACIERLVKKWGIEKVRQIIKILPKTNKMRFAPTIYTPFQLESKLGSLIDFLQKEKNRGIQPL